jgi:pimeloyl-ACP methyl ester carboxylesterase
VDGISIKAVDVATERQHTLSVLARVSLFATHQGKHMRIPQAIPILLCAAFLSAVALASHDTPQTPIVVESRLPFDALPEFPDTQRYWGTHQVAGKSAGYRIEVPSNWNGSLVMVAHGFRGGGPELTVDSPDIRAYLVANGFAWAASSYYRNFYDVRAGVLSTNALARHFDAVTGLAPERYFIHGGSMGGHVAAAAIEQFPNRTCPAGKRGQFCRDVVEYLGKLAGGVKYSGAVLVCGVTGDTRLFDYYHDFNLVAAYLADVQVPRPPPPDFTTAYLPLIKSKLFLTYPTVNTPLGDKLQAATIELTGGPRPIVNQSYATFMDLLFSLGTNDGSIPEVTHGLSVVSNIGRVYQLDHDPRLSAEEKELNRTAVRFSADPNANPPEFIELELIPTLTGNLHVPTVSLHTLGDLFVPFSMQQIYAQRARQWKRDHMLVNRAIRAAQHCEFSLTEQERAFADMVRWVDEGVKPAGDRILDRQAVEDESFGCQFTTPVRPYDTVGCTAQ